MARQQFRDSFNDRYREPPARPGRRSFTGPYGGDDPRWHTDHRDQDFGVSGDDRNYPAGFGAGYGGSDPARAQSFGRWSPPQPYGGDPEPERYPQRSWGRDPERGETYAPFARERGGAYGAAQGSSGGMDFGDYGSYGDGWRPRDPGRAGFDSQHAGRDDGWGRDTGRTSLSDLYGEQQQRQRQVPQGYTRSDERIKDDVCEKLFHANDVEIADVSIEVKSGTVTLEGCVPQRQMKHRIEDIVEQCIGVTDVENRIRVQRADQTAPSGIGSDSERGRKAATQASARH